MMTLICVLTSYSQPCCGEEGTLTAGVATWTVGVEIVTVCVGT